MSLLQTGTSHKEQILRQAWEDAQAADAAERKATAVRMAGIMAEEALRRVWEDLFEDGEMAEWVIDQIGIDGFNAALRSQFMRRKVRRGELSVGGRARRWTS